MSASVKIAGNDLAIAMNERRDTGNFEFMLDPVRNDYIRFCGTGNEGKMLPRKSGYRTIRRATPSSSISAETAVS